jgi:hypothetical protein
MIPKLGTSFAVKSHNFTQFHLLLAFVEIKLYPAELNFFMKRLHMLHKIALFFPTETAVQAVEAGVGAVSIMDGRVRHCILKALSGEVFGTSIVKG